MLEDLIDAVFARAFLDQGKALPRTGEAFNAALQAGRSSLVSTGETVENVLLDTLQSLVSVRQRLTGLKENHPAREDIMSQLDGLFAPGFLYRTPWDWLSHYPRYLKALDTRLERIEAHGVDELAVRVGSSRTI